MSALIVESLHSRLARLVPGAVVTRREHARPGERYQVTRPAPRAGATVQLLAVADSEREAVDRAVFLFGGQR